MKKILIACLCLLAVLSSCGDERKQRIRKIVSEWTGKTIRIPETDTYFLNRDTIAPQIASPYRILVYTDSVGCVSCKLKLNTWKLFIREADSLFAGKLDFIFFFHPKDERELQFIFKREKFDHIIHMDREAKLQQLNSLPPEMEYQCFLLDKDNKVISIGNPTLNPRIWELYKSLITTEEAGQADSKPVTTIAIQEEELHAGNLSVGKTSDIRFRIKNTGTAPLIISHIDSSCGCAVPGWEKKPVAPDAETEIEVKVTPDARGYFRKTVTVFCNTEEKFHTLVVSGEVKN